MAFVNAFSAVGRLLVLGGLVLGATAFGAAGANRIVLLTVALTIAIGGIALSIVGSKLGRISSLDARLRASGVPGSGVVTSVRPLPVLVNGAPVVEVALDVSDPVHPDRGVTIRQRVPRDVIDAIRPGDRFGVVVAPDDPEHLAIDWAVEVIPPSETPHPSPLSPPGLSGSRDLEHLLASGRRARAIVISMSDMGDMSELGLVEVESPGQDGRMFVVDMEVTQAGMDTYEVRVNHQVPERLVGRVGPRTKVDVAIDRDDDHVVAIDWDSVGR